MSFDLADRENARDRYLFLCFIAFMASAILYDKDNPVWLIEAPFGFFGGVIFSYIVFCRRNRKNPSELPMDSWEAPGTLTFYILCILSASATLWVIASGGSPIIVMGALIGQATFQTEYESWWDEKQKLNLEKKIRSELDLKINTKIDELRQELKRAG